MEACGGLSVSGGGGGASRDDGLVSESAGIKLLRQDVHRLLELMGSMSARVSRLEACSAQAAYSAGPGPGGASSIMGPVPGGRFLPGSVGRTGGVGGGLQGDRDARTEAALRAVQTNRIFWCLRGRWGAEIVTDADLQTCLGGQVSVNTNIYNTFHMLLGIDITYFAPVGNAVSIMVGGQFDLACACVVTLLKFGYSDDVVTDAACDARIAPLVAAMDAARLNYEAELRPVQDILEESSSRSAFAPIPWKDFPVWGKSLRRGSFVFLPWTIRPSHSPIFLRRPCWPLRRFTAVSNPAVLGFAWS